MKQLISCFLILGILALPVQARRRWMPVSAAATPNLTVNAWQDWSFNTTIDASTLSSHDHSSGAITWTVLDASTLLTAATTGGQTNVSTINTLTSTAGSLTRTYGTTALSALQMDIGAGNSTATVSGGFWFKYTGSPTVNKTLFRITNGIGQDVCAARFLYSTQTLDLFGGTATNTALSANTWYWITYKSVNGGTCRIQPYNTSGATVGSEGTATGDVHDNRNWYIFDYNSQISDSGVTIVLGNFVVDWTTGTYPLGP